MKKTWFVIVGIVLTASGVFAQQPTQPPAQPAQPPERSNQPYEPAVPPPSVSVYGGYGGYGDGSRGAGSTPAGSFMAGMSDVISAKGNYNLATSAAAVNMTQARSNEMQNHMQYENTYFQMRAQNQAYRAAEQGPRPTEEQLVRIAREGAPKPLTSSDVNPVNGSVSWPAMLQQNTFAEDRSKLEDQLSAKKAAHGSLGFSDQMAARKTIESMFAQLKSQISSAPPQDYLASREFLKSMIYSLAHTSLS